MDEKSSSGRNPLAISYDAFERSFDSHIKPLCLDEEELSRKSYDEVSILFGALWTQQQLIKNGLASGSIILFGYESKDSDIFGIRATLRMYEDHLKAREDEASTAAVNFSHVADLEQPLGTGYLFSSRFLTYCTALIRSPSQHGMPPTTSDGLLTASGLPAPSADRATNEGSFEMLQLNTVHGSLASDLNVMDDHVSAVFLERLECNGFISSSAPIDTGAMKSGKGWISFGLPLLMDSSPTVELLISAVEVMLDDLDLTFNEQALRLMSMRAFPSLLCSPYALERLGVALINWVISTVSSENSKITDGAGSKPSQGCPRIREQTSSNPRPAHTNQ